MLEAMRTGGADCAAAELMVAQRMEALARSASENFFDIDVLCTVRLWWRADRAVYTRFITNENLIVLVNGIGVLNHRAGEATWFCPVAFIFGECASIMVNRFSAHPYFSLPPQFPA
jgi:hypothetical protein